MASGRGSGRGSGKGGSGGRGGQARSAAPRSSGGGKGRGKGGGASGQGPRNPLGQMGPQGRAPRRSSTTGLGGEQVEGRQAVRELLLANRREAPLVSNDSDIHVLLAPSWGEETILPVCGDELADVLMAAGFRLTLRPHYQTRWKMPEVIDRIVARHGSNPRFRLVEQMGESDSLYDSHLMITDWSGAGQDYGMGLEKPVLYIDVPPKARNDTWPELGMEPFESYVRARLGALLKPERLT